ncbi:MAG: hypothetical protein PQ964_09150 [Methanobacteriaceae archaeon]|jgi:hypothetical protein
MKFDELSIHYRRFLYQKVSFCNGLAKKYMWIIPAIAVFFIALIPTFEYQWPLSWDIIYHVQFAKVYSQYGFTLINPLANAPVGEKIAYPPLFHFLIAGLGNLLEMDYFQLARSLQPILAFSIVLSVSYVAKELYGKIAGISAGFLMISSHLVFRIMLPVPENLALIFIPFAAYFYYISIEKKILKYALISGILFLPVVASHQAAILCLVLVIISFTLLELVMHRNIRVFKNLFAFFSLLIIVIILGLILLLIWKPDLFFRLLNEGLSALGFSVSLNYTLSLSPYTYSKLIGPVVIISTLIGGIFAVKKRCEKNYFIIIWIISLFLLSNAHWFGINVLTPRVLIYLLIPLAIFGGFGISELYYNLKKYKKFSSSQIRSGFLICIFIISSVLGAITVSGSVFSFQAETSLGNIQIAPPSASEVDVANWFSENGNKSRSFITSNLYTGNLIATIAEIPIHYGFEYFNKSTPLPAFENRKIGYIVLDKRLTFPSKDGTLYLQAAPSELYPLFFFSKDIESNLREIVPPYAVVVHKNNDFIICKIPWTS